MKECRSCGHPLSDETKFCPVCGNPVPQYYNAPVQNVMPQGNTTQGNDMLTHTQDEEAADNAVNMPEPEVVEVVENVAEEAVNEAVDEALDEVDESSVPYDVYLGKEKNYKPYYIGAAVLALIVLGALWWMNSGKNSDSEVSTADTKTVIGNGFYSYEGKWNTGTDSILCRVEFEKVGDTLLNCVYTNLSKNESSPLTFRSSSDKYIFKDKESDGKKIVLQVRKPANGDSRLEGEGLFLAYDTNERLLALNNSKRTKEDLEKEAKAGQAAAAAAQQKAAQQKAAQQKAAQQKAAQEAAAQQQAAARQQQQRQRSTRPTPQPNPAEPRPATLSSNNRDVIDSQRGNRHTTNISGHGDTTKDKAKTSSKGSRDIKD